MGLPITLCLIVRNSNGRLKEVIKHHKDIVSDVVVIDQCSTDGTYEEAKEFADIVVSRRNKGKCDADRNFAFQLGKEDWVLNLDDDEFMTEDSMKAIGDVLKVGADIVWVRRENFINGVSFLEQMGDDPQCRLFRRGSVQWSDTTHKYPEAAPGSKTFYSNLWLNHIRTYDQIIKTHSRRALVLEPDMLRLEQDFVANVGEELRKKGALNAQVV